MRKMSDTFKRGRGRPKGSKNKSKIDKLVKTEISPAELVDERKFDMVLPDIREDAISALLREDAEIETDYKSEPSLPKIGKFYVMKIREPDNKSRILISHIDFNDSFPLTTRKIITTFGAADGLACPIVMRFVDVITDPESEEPIGIYHVISTPSMVRTGVDPRKIASSLSKPDIDNQMSEYTRHRALSYKMQRDLWRKDAETYKEQYKDLAEKRMEISEELAATAIEMLVNAIMASKEMFDEIRKKNMPWYQRYQMEILAIVAVLALIWLFSSGAVGG
jgi:hypothetical protein